VAYKAYLATTPTPGSLDDIDTNDSINKPGAQWPSHARKKKKTTKGFKRSIPLLQLIIHQYVIYNLSLAFPCRANLIFSR
jgi:hypothetical protein